MEIDNKDRIVVGVNEFESNSNIKSHLQKIDQRAVESQIEKLKKFKENRDKKLLVKSLKLLTQSIEDNDNLMPSIVKCIESNATLGEISDILRNKFGEYKS